MESSEDWDIEKAISSGLGMIDFLTECDDRQRNYLEESLEFKLGTVPISYLSPHRGGVPPTGGSTSTLCANLRSWVRPDRRCSAQYHDFPCRSISCEVCCGLRPFLGLLHDP